MLLSIRQPVIWEAERHDVVTRCAALTTTATELSIMADTASLRFALTLGAWLAIGLLAGGLIGALEGERPEIAVGAIGGLVGGVLHVLIGGRRRGLEYWGVGPLVGASILLLAYDLLEVFQRW